MCQNAKNFDQKGKDTFFIPPRGEWAAEVFQSLFNHSNGKIRVRSGWVPKEGGRFE
jgi:hypothetical protein